MKFLKIVGFVLLLLVAALLILPYLFRDKVKDVVVSSVNDLLNAEVYMEDFSLGFFSNFPNATLTLDGFGIKGVDEFENDTLLDVKKLDVVVNLSSLFKDAYEVNKIAIVDPVVTAKVLANGKANWDIVKSDSTGVEASEEETSALRLDLDVFKIDNLKASYESDPDSMSAKLEGVNLALAGDLALDLQTLANIDQLNLLVDQLVYENRSSSPMNALLQSVDLQFKGKVSDQVSDLKLLLDVDSTSLSMNNIPYLSKAQVKANVDMVADLENNKYTFAENSVSLNEITANFDGFVQLLDSSAMDMDVKLNTPSIEFKQILSLIPAIYSKEFESIQTSGKVSLDASAKGVMVGDTLPKIDAKLNIADARFKYPDLPSEVKDINIEAYVTNPGGATDSTVVNVPKCSLNMAGNPFAVTLNVKTPVSDPDFSATADGVINLGTISQVIYLEDVNLHGILTAALKASGKMSYVDQERYELFILDGKLRLNDFVMKTKSLDYDVNINNALLGFTSQHVNMDANIGLGKSDISVTGKLQNFIQYVMRGETIKGSLDVKSKLIDTNELLGASAEEAPTESTANDANGSVAIPSNVDFALNLSVDQLQYDAINLSSLKGNMGVKDAVAKINSLTANAMGGSVSVKGEYNTVDTLNPKVDVNMNVNNMNVSEVFSTVKTAKKLVPMLKDAQGNFNLTMKFASNMDATLSPILNTVNAKGNFSSKEIALKNVDVLNQIADKVNFSALKDPKVKNINVSFSVKDGRLYADPFETMISTAVMNLTGSSGLDQSLDYTAKIKLPKNVSVAGTDVNLGFDVLVGGTILKPVLKVSAASVLNNVKEVVTEKIDEAKQKAIAEATAQKEKLVKAANEQKDKLVKTARTTADKAIAKAQAQSDSIVAKAANPIAKAAAKKSGEALIKKAKSDADKVVKEAETKGNKLVSDAEAQGDALIKKAQETEVKK